MNEGRIPWSEWPGWPYLLIGLTVLIRLAHIWNSRSNPTFWAPAVDPAWYDQAAQRIVDGNWGPFPFFRAPVYPALLALVYSAFGHDLVAARILNVVLQGATVWIIWWVGRSYFSAAIGILAAALFALNGMTIYFACELVSPSIEMLTTVLCAWTTFRLLRDSSVSAVAVCGLSYGFAAITRPNSLLLYPLVLVILWLILTNGKLWVPARIKRHFLSVPVWIIAASVPILPVTATNLIKSGEFVLIATQGGVNFWIGNSPEASGGLAILPGHANSWEMEDAEIEAARDVGRHLNQGELSSYYYQKAWTYIEHEPLHALRLMIRKAALFFNRFEISNNKHIQYFARLSPWLPPLIWFNFAVLVPFGALGIWVTWRKPETRILLALILVYALSVMLFFVTARFRMPTVPWLCWLAAGGMVWIIHSIRNHVRLRNWAPALVLIPVGILTFMNIWQLNDAPYGWARLMEANAYMELNQPDSARAGFYDAIRNHQDLRTAYLNLGVMAYQDKNYDDARKWYELALREDSTFWKAWNNLGTVLEEQGDTLSAIEAYKRARVTNPLAEDAKVNLAGAYFRFGVRALKLDQDSSAAAYLDSAVALEADPAAYYNLALAYLRLGKYDLAETSLNQAVALNSNLPGASRLRELIRSGSTAPPPTAVLP
jgi:tetratricopeptide (TPR) repeat protein